MNSRGRPPCRSRRWKHGEFSQEWMDSRFRGNDEVGLGLWRE